MEKFTDEKGITVITMVITVILLIIISSIALQSGKSVIENAKLTAFSTELEIMQRKVDELNQKKNSGDGTINVNGRVIAIDSLGEELTGSEQEQTAFAGAEVDSSGFRYYTYNTLDQLGVEHVSQEFLVNVDKKKVISLKGIKNSGAYYYTIEKIPSGLYTLE